MDFLNNIDFKNHDGVNLAMINDFMRNQFYDRVLAHNVNNQHCMDIGFGTGFLSVLALKHGAKHITAYESDRDRYQLGCKMLDMLQLTDRITLLNQRYTHRTGLSGIDVVFTETVNGNLWWEGLYSSVPRHPGTKFLPGQYFLEIHAQSIPESFARGLIEFCEDQYRFAPGVDIDDRFVSAVNLMVCKKYNLPIRPRQHVELNQGIVCFTRQHSTVWGWIPFQRAVTQGQCVDQYVFDIETSKINNQDIDFDQQEFTMCIDTSAWYDQTVLIVPRAGMQHRGDRMYLDTGHWGPTEDPIILHRPQGPLVVTHNLQNGKITYKLEE